MFTKKGIKVSCRNCGAHTRVIGRYGECDYCGGPLIAPIADYVIAPTTDHAVADFVSLEIKAIKRHNEQSALKADILRVLHRTELCTVSEIANQLREPVPVQKVSDTLRKMIDEGAVDRTEIRKKVVFFAKEA